MSWQVFIDGYDCKARFIPTVVTLLPLFWSGYYLYPGILGSPLLLAGSGLLSVALIYLASMVVKDLGVRYALQFWKANNALPSTRFGRMRDSFFNGDQKRRMRSAVHQRFGIQLLSLHDELENPQLADRKIMAAFREIKELLRQSGKSALIEKHNAEYGFVRNLCGSRTIFVVLGAAGVAICGFKGAWPRWTLNPGVFVDLILLALWIPFAWGLLPRMVRLNADTYAGRAWTAFLSMADDLGKKPSAFDGLIVQDRDFG